jgi:hypothetical protein
MDYSTLIGRKVVQGGFKGKGEDTIVSVEGDIIFHHLANNIDAAIAANPTDTTLLTLKNNI